MAVNDQNWDARAECLDHDPELFFPVSKTGRAFEQIAEAKAVCSVCAVRVECLDFAIRTQANVGVWGGLDADERQLRQRFGSVSA